MNKFKKDAFSRSRGSSVLYSISCAHCGNEICKYQKDGPGPLKRMYLDRMITMDSHNATLNCQSCSRTLGTAMVYEKESRPAYRLYVGAVAKGKTTLQDSL